MRLKSKIFTILVAVVTFYAVMDQVLQRHLLLPRFFTELEQRKAQEDARRILAAIQREVTELSVRCGDWARSDQTCRFVELAPAEAQATDFARTELGYEALKAAQIHLLYICAPDGTVVWHWLRDPVTWEPLKLLEFPSQSMTPGRGLMLHADALADNSGIMMPGGRTLLVSSRPIVASSTAGPARGVMILGRFLADDIEGALERSTQVKFDYWPLYSSDLPEEARVIQDEVTSSTDPVAVVQDSQLMHVYATVDDINQNPALLVRAAVPREIAANGLIAMRYAFLSTIAAGLLMLLVLMTLLQRVVLAPIARLTQHALAVGRTDDTYARLGSDRPDEIGILSREFDAMLGKLGDSRRALVDTARAAGMSEIATGVLHNVGNVLNSVNVSANLVAQRMRSTGLADLERVVEVLDQHTSDLPSFLSGDPRGKHLHPFLKSLTSQLVKERADLEHEVYGLAEGIEHVKVLVKAQQTYARRTEVLEPTDLAEQLEAALGISYQVLPKNSQLVVKRELEPLPRVSVDRHKLMEILVNVVLNARQSMAEAGASPPELTFSIVRVGPDRVRIGVADNGLGIPPDNLTRIFKHGFTTKKNGHGFGLHTAANAAKEMGGSLQATSDGPGRGAAFVLDIPCRVVASEVALAS